MTDTRRPLTLLVACAASVSLALTGCASQSDASEDAVDDTTTSTTAPADIPDGWLWAEGTNVPSITAEPALPVTVTDGTNTEVTISDASKIIVGGDDVADILAGLGLGDLVYAAPTNSASETAKGAPEQFEFSKTTGTEGLLAIDGTLFIGNNTARHGDVAEQFRSAGVDAAVVNDQQSVADKIRAVASFLGIDAAGDELASDVEDQLAEAASIAEDGDIADLRILQVTADGAGGANAVVGTGTAGADIVEAIGATNVGVDAGLRGYSVQYSDEGLLGEKPDVILVGTADLEEWGGLEGFVEAFPTLLDTPAGQAGNIIVMPSTQIKVSGPASGAGAVALAQALVDLEG
ncbi:heme/hemin ABC transporter substrate-binding protein [Paramicrobacterium chengjingii]|uniref:heme/hemin ABC transporter substrate-binding protein n=1 Tax=Paramicrobacterium chengjingii TaxID=2769067 RepID=UPI00142187FE|nr:ABC transporter substrate-binding protein [Microbacterium chengjingii]